VNRGVALDCRASTALTLSYMLKSNCVVTSSTRGFLRRSMTG
jgi:hypothetical protein